MYFMYVNSTLNSAEENYGNLKYIGKEMNQWSPRKKSMKNIIGIFKDMKGRGKKFRSRRKIGERGWKSGNI